jgi:hypothetical protein
VKAWIAPEFSSFLVGGPSSSALSSGAISGMGCMVLQLYPKFQSITGGPRYPGY